VKLDLPDNHPIAEVIRNMTEQGWPGQLMLSLDHFSRDGVKRIFALEIDSWSLIQPATRFELELTDHAERVRELERLTNWPDNPMIPTND
jgi:hypothetical protein